MKLDKETRRKLKIYKNAKRVERKLKTRRSTIQQRNSWKNVLAKAMREFPTNAEKLITPTMRHLGFMPQVVILGYIPDFAHIAKRVIVEVDGSSHANKQAYDYRRDEVFRSHGWKIIRVTNQDVNNRPLDVYNKICCGIVRET